MSLNTRQRQRFWQYVVIGGEQDCWLWTGHTVKGYGHFRVGKRMSYAHRLAYEELVGTISDGLVLDHLCRVQKCVNPAHLEPVTSRINTLRGQTNAAANIRKTHCPKGHEYDLFNTFVQGRRRYCRSCREAYFREYRRKKVEAS